MPFTVEGETSLCALMGVCFAVFRIREGELVPVEVVDVNVALVLGDTARALDHVQCVVMPAEGAISLGAVR